jgi:hypothetical protein
MKKYLNEKFIDTLANFYSTEEVTYKTEDERWETRMPIDWEREVLYKIFKGAIWALNWGEMTRSDKGRRQAIIDSAEFMANEFLPQLNNYNTVYCRLQKIDREWEEV